VPPRGPRPGTGEGFRAPAGPPAPRATPPRRASQRRTSCRALRRRGKAVEATPALVQFALSWRGSGFEGLGRGGGTVELDRSSRSSSSAERRGARQAPAGGRVGVVLNSCRSARAAGSGRCPDQGGGAAAGPLTTGSAVWQAVPAPHAAGGRSCRRCRRSRAAHAVTVPGRARPGVARRQWHSDRRINQRLRFCVMSIDLLSIRGFRVRSPGGPTLDQRRQCATAVCLRTLTPLVNTISRHERCHGPMARTLAGGCSREVTELTPVGQSSLRHGLSPPLMESAARCVDPT
jgi:hypothetical protein